MESCIVHDDLLLHTGNRSSYTMPKLGYNVCSVHLVFFSLGNVFQNKISLCVHLTGIMGMDTLVTKLYMEGHHNIVKPPAQSIGCLFNDYNCHGMITIRRHPLLTMYMV